MVTPVRPAPNALGADVSVGGGGSGGSHQTWTWPAGQLADDAFPIVLQMIEGLGTAHAARSRVAQGSVTADHVSLSYQLNEAPTLAERAKGEPPTPLAALSAAQALVSALVDCAEQGVSVGRWDPALLQEVDAGAWSLPTPGLHALPVGKRPLIVSVTEASGCAPEAATGAVELSNCTPKQRAQAEAYAVGATLYWVLSGVLPLDAESPESYCRAQLESAPESLLAVCPHLERYATLVRLVDRCLARSPDERPGSHAELEQELSVAAREADRLENSVSFFPLRVSDSEGMDLPSRRPPNTETRKLAARHNQRQIWVLVALIGLLLFLLYYQTHETDSSFPTAVRATEIEAP